MLWISDLVFKSVQVLHPWHRVFHIQRSRKPNSCRRDQTDLTGEVSDSSACVRAHEVLTVTALEADVVSSNYTSLKTGNLYKNICVELYENGHNISVPCWWAPTLRKEHTASFFRELTLRYNKKIEIWISCNFSNKQHNMLNSAQRILSIYSHTICFCHLATIGCAI